MSIWRRPTRSDQHENVEKTSLPLLSGNNVALSRITGTEKFVDNEIAVIKGDMAALHKSLTVLQRLYLEMRTRHMM